MRKRRIKLSGPLQGLLILSLVLSVVFVAPFFLLWFTGLVIGFDGLKPTTVESPFANLCLSVATGKPCR